MSRCGGVLHTTAAHHGSTPRQCSRQVGKTTLLRHLAEGLIPLPKFLNVVHVEQEITGDERSPLETIVQADQEREWLLACEKLLCDGDDDVRSAFAPARRVTCASPMHVVACGALPRAWRRISRGSWGSP